MKPRNKTEREIVKFSNMIPELSDKQREWAIKTCISEDDAYKYSDRFSRDVSILYVHSRDGRFLDISR